MPVSSYTMKDVVNTIAFRVANVKDRIDTLENPDLVTQQIIEVVNEVIRDLARVKPIPMMNGRTYVNTVDDYDTGTVTVAKGSTAVTGSGTSWTSDMVGRAFSLKVTGGVYRISAVTDGTTMTLSEPWAGDARSGEGYIIAQDRYTLPSDYMDQLSVVLEGMNIRKLEAKRPTEMDLQRYSLRLKAISTGTPQRFTVYDRDSDTGNWQIELDPFPDDEYRIAIRYKKVPVYLRHDHDEIPIPDENISYLYSGCVALWKSFTTEQGMDLYERWFNNVMGRYSVFDSRSTDEAKAIVPDDVMRSPRRRSTIFDTAE